MTSEMNVMVAREHVSEMRRRSAGVQEIDRVVTATARPSLELRLASVDDGEAVDRITALDDARPLDGQVLLAIIDGEAVAALSLLDGRVVANPFMRTIEAVELLRRWADDRSPSRARRRPRLRPRFA
jgi:hypothetical protein